MNNEIATAKVHNKMQQNRLYKAEEGQTAAIVKTMLAKTQNSILHQNNKNNILNKNKIKYSL
jgi:hypothetical protein